MGKRSDFERRKNDLYETWDPRAVRALLPYLKPGTRFVEPCAGAGVLLDQLEAAGHTCVEAYDIEPWGHGLSPWWRGIAYGDALTRRPSVEFDQYITNPAWTREILHPLIEHLSDHAPCWLLFDWDWWCTKQSAALSARCRRVVPIGRLRWIPGSSHDGKDNCAWFLFDRPAANEGAILHARAA